MFNIYLGIYIIAAIFIIAGGAFKLNAIGQSLTALIFFIGALYVFIIYGIRWFEGKTAIFSKTPVSWPPTINTCPDYLMFYGRKMTDGTTQDSCIDTIGVSRNGALKVFPKGTTPPSGDDYYFPLATKNSDKDARKAELCQRAITNGLTWEGITNGESCITPNGNVSPGTGGSGASGCPA